MIKTATLSPAAALVAQIMAAKVASDSLPKRAKPSGPSPMFPQGFAHLVKVSYPIRRELEMNGRVVTFTSHVPTDLDHDGTDELFAGWRESWGTCIECQFLKSANGTCAC